MAYINKKDTNGTKPLLAEGELGYDKYAAGGDAGRVYVGTGSANIALAKKSEVDAKVVANTAITGATKAKITYDSKGLVTSGADLVAADIPTLSIAKTTGLQTALDSKAPLDSPALTGTPTAPTPTVSDNSTKVATTAYVQKELDLLKPSGSTIYTGAYGLNWNETNDTYTRTGVSNFTAIQSLMRRCVLNADGTVNYYLDPYNSNYKVDGSLAKLDGTDGNVMVEVPKFYYKYNYNTTSGVVHEHSISLTPDVEYTVHDAFVRGGVEVDYRYYPAYLGYSSGGKLLSRSGVYPTVSQTRAQFRTLARANGAGWEQIDFLLYEAITLLMVIEYGTMNIQAALGQGRTALTGGSWVNGSLIGINGLSNRIGNGTGNVTYAGSADDAAADGSFMSYRGCENFFGNVWRFVDGINCQGNMAKLVYLNQNPATYADDVFTGDYVSIGVTTANATGYARTLGNTRKGFIPVSVSGGSSSVGTTDYYYTSSTVNTLALVGGSADRGLNAGPLTLYAADAVSLSVANVGAGVCR